MRNVFKILAPCLGLSLLIPLTSCSTTTKEEEEEKKDPEKEKQKLDSIMIVSDIKPLYLETNQPYVSNEIEVKCFDTKQKEMQVKTNLALTPLEGGNIDISLENNKVRIGTNKPVGSYKYQLTATNEDRSIMSSPKIVQIQVYKNKELPNKIEINGSEKESYYAPIEASVQYELVGKLDDKIIEEFDPTCQIDVSITPPKPGLEKDIFGNPMFSVTQDNKTLTLKVNPNIDSRYTGDYEVSFKSTLLCNPTVSTVKTVKIQLIYALEYKDSNNFFYSRETINSNWYLKTVPSSIKGLTEKDFMTEKYGVTVNGIGDNFCESSGIKDMVTLALPSTIQWVGDYAFYKQEALASLNASNLLYIGENAFYMCSLMLSDPELQWKTQYIGKQAFWGCEMFEPKYFNEAKYVGENAFTGSNISQIHFGSNLSIIGAGAFSDCTSLENIYISATTPPTLLGDIISGSTPSNCKIHVPSSSIEIYRNSPNWGHYSSNLVGDM